VNEQKLILETAKKVLRVETEVLSELSKSLDNTLVDAVRHIMMSEGRVVVTGVGKSALVAQKIVATLNSTGTPSIFMHASDAVHGDLGMIRSVDTLICLSKSGETEELKVLLPLIRSTGVKIIAFTSNPGGYLAQQSDFVLNIPVREEADPNNLAPTASTTAQMAMGDAIAIALLALRGFTATDFAKFHPGGSLGRRLFLRVREIYPRNQLPIVRPGDQVRNVIIEITSKRLGATAVLDQNERICGIITDGDLRRMIESTMDIDGLTAADIMSDTPKVIDSEALAVEALEIMRNNNISQLLVVKNSRYVGVVHLHDLIREGII
jgi:arabinose-5-phosphate isomerase